MTRQLKRYLAQGETLREESWRSPSFIYFWKEAVKWNFWWLFFIIINVAYIRRVRICDLPVISTLGCLLVNYAYSKILYPASPLPMCLFYNSVPDPSDPHVFGPPGSGSFSQRYGSGYFHHPAKIVSKTLIPTVFWLSFDFLSLKNDVNVPSKSNKQKNFFLNSFLLVSWRSMKKIAGSGSISPRLWSGSVPKWYGSAYCLYQIKIHTQDQRYSSPRAAVLERGADLVIVGRGISGALDPTAEAERYRQEAWQAYR